MNDKRKRLLTGVRVLQLLCLVLVVGATMCWDSTRPERVQDFGTVLFWLALGAVLVFGFLESRLIERGESENRPTDRTLVYLLYNCAFWGVATAILMGAYGVERRNDPLLVTLLLSFVAAAFLPLLALPLVRHFRK